MPLRILSVFGTRPEAIKMAPLVKALEADNDFTSLVAVTAQHREMLDQVLELFEIKPDYDLDIMSPNQDLFDVTSKALLGLRDVIREAKPDALLVHGDTTTCLAGALAGFYEGIPVGHVEAGLRSGDMKAPFPEEANRALVGRIASLHFSPTASSEQNLLRENTDPNNIVVTGNTVIDALLSISERLKSFPDNYWLEALSDNVAGKILDRSGKFILITGHRRENFGQGFLDLCEALHTLATQHPDWLFVYPVHLNPNVQKPVKKILGDTPNIVLTEPVSYLPFTWLLNQCDLVITDSGGIQEEAPSLGKPVLVTREVTERPEAVDAGTVKLVGTNKQLIFNTVNSLFSDSDTYNSMSKAINPYGDGKACPRILKRLKQYFNA
ncbi:MAG: UDP-N-acetylglucosamine 2-epimerase (non-hydrolyzing) [Cellvibrionaceae bacterium]